jgi:hypothetical protein
MIRLIELQIRNTRILFVVIIKKGISNKNPLCFLLVFFLIFYRVITFIYKLYSFVRS